MEAGGYLRVLAVIPVLFCVTGLAREVRIQAGPLYRARGNAVSIRCNVSRYEGPPTQTFEWFMYRAGAPDVSIAIASTKEAEFSYAVYAARVRSGDVSIRRLSGDSTELHIQRLRDEDDGVYECHTPSTDSAYLGTYSAKVTLTVIPDTLQVSSKMAAKGRLSSALTLPEGGEFNLTCSASTDSARHTHLSVTFSVSDPDRDIISMGRDFTVYPSNDHAASRERFLNGEIHLEKTDGVTYRMVIPRLRPQDTGSYHCTAAQWLLDPDGSWQRITERRSALGRLDVRSVDSQMKVSASPPELHVQSGGMVELFCNVSVMVSPPPDLVLSLEWWVSSSPQSPGQLVASMSPDGTVYLGESYAGTRHVSLEKIPSGTFRLRIYSAQPGDIGAYSCRAAASVSYPGGRLEEVSRRTSQGVNVLMRVQDLSLNVATFLDSASLYRGDTASLLCNVTLETPQAVHVAVSWWAELSGEQPNQRTGRLLASMDRQGVSEEGTRPSGLSTDKAGAQCFRLRLYNIQAEDEGLYHCAVTAWIQYPDRSWYNAGSARSNAINIYPYAQAKDLLLIPMIGGVASALFVGITILSTVTCCYLRQLRIRKR